MLSVPTADDPHRTQGGLSNYAIRTSARTRRNLLHGFELHRRGRQAAHALPAHPSAREGQQEAGRGHAGPAPAGHGGDPPLSEAGPGTQQGRGEKAHLLHRLHDGLAEHDEASLEVTTYATPPTKRPSAPGSTPISTGTIQSCCSRR